MDLIDPDERALPPLPAITRSAQARREGGLEPLAEFHLIVEGFAGRDDADLGSRPDRHSVSGVRRGCRFETRGRRKERPPDPYHVS